jgi:hypothetical protein
MISHPASPQGVELITESLDKAIWSANKNLLNLMIYFVLKEILSVHIK